jgi:hypothetical protein
VEIFRILQVPRYEDACDDRHDTFAPFFHAAQIIMFAFCSPCKFGVKDWCEVK